MLAGTVAGWNKNQRVDSNFRITAFVSSAIPTFILALILMDMFYVILYWFPPERLGLATDMLVKSGGWHSITGLATVEGLLNGKPEVTLDAFRHLVLPVITVCLFYWATLGRITRAGIIEETQKDYILAARARGVDQPGLDVGTCLPQHPDAGTDQYCPVGGLAVHRCVHRRNDLQLQRLI